MLGVLAVRFLSIPEFLSWLFVQYGSRIVLLQENPIWVTYAEYFRLKIS